LIIKIELEMVPRLVGPPQQTTTEPGINEIADNFLPLVPSQIFCFLNRHCGLRPAICFFAVGGIRRGGHQPGGEQQIFAKPKISIAY
jgi:hypothetical protein